MPTFESEAQLRAAMLQGAKIAVSKAQETMYLTMKQVLSKFYGEYYPNISIRTMQLFNSLQKSEIRSTGSGYEADVYFDVSMMHHLDRYVGQHGFIVHKKWSEEEIMSRAMSGGTQGHSTAIYTEGVGILNGIMIEELVAALRAAGLPIR